MEALREIFRPVTPGVLLALLGACVVVAVAWFVWNRVRALAWLVKCRNLVLALLLGAMAAMGVYSGFAKYTNDPPNTVGSPRRGDRNGASIVHQSQGIAARSVSGPYQITDEDVSNGWRVVYTADGAALTPPFEGVVTNVDWRLSGAYDDSMRINPVGWTLPWKDGTMNGITVLAWCEFMPNVMANYFPALFSDKVSLVPECNWHLIPSNSVPYEGSATLTTNESVFWYGITTNNSLVLTWQNATYARDANCPTNFQAELFANGSFEYRYDDRTVGYSRVHPLDLDFDGLPNTIDPEPETPLATPAWNQSEAWVAAAFPSNAAEIASAGGYNAWVAQRAADPNRRLVRLNVALQGGRWPVCVDVGIVPVMADGSSDLLYAIDCGAQVPFSLSDGELASVLVRRTIPPSDFQTFIQADFQTSSFPHEWSVGDVTVHLDDPQAGWMRRTADVDVDDSELTHLHPGESAHLTAVVTNCHADAYLGCAWHGGEGISFSNPHSLATTLTYASSSTVQWATNNAYLVTSYAGGYSLTNTIWFTVGIEEEPTPCFTLGCQKVFFLNDADFLNDGPCPTNRPERIRPVTLNLLGPYGTNGTVKLSAQGSASPVMFYIDNGVTNLITETTEIPLEVTDQFARTGTNTFYVSCPSVGTGTISATLTLDGGATLSDTVSFKCIEPLRKLVTTEKDAGRFVNPSRLVMGTNAVLEVGVNGDFDATNVDWCVSGPGRKVSTSGWRCTVEPTGTDGVVTVEARFNDDEIQPQFVLPVVEPRVIPVKIYVFHSLEEEYLDAGIDPTGVNSPWIDSDILAMLNLANDMFAQVGITFNLIGINMIFDEPKAWNIPYGRYARGADGKWVWQHSDEMMGIVLRHYEPDCVRIYFVGDIRSNEKIKGMATPYGVFVGRRATRKTLAHELGHALGLNDCYAFRLIDKSRPINNDNCINIEYADNPVDKTFFRGVLGDWGAENGRGFYEVSDTRRNIMQKLLMHGSVLNAVGGVAPVADERGDIPTKCVISLKYDAKASSETFISNVGEKAIKENNSEVYSK